ncbi:HTTM domain-containing protein [Haloarcula sp. GH36]|uniref:HTTM domain-containing protein n=1 Tax=Haloarcula montana TaxID=3111776 RepID=UPI002D79C570|nr:HTTM domain-containing protein [Haloarcula sp. GH36]
MGTWQERLPQRLRAAVRDRVAVDTRSLGVVRISLGLLLLSDLLLRARDLRAHYSDSGVFPRPAAIELYDPLSVHLVVGDVPELAALFALQGIVALAFLVGYRTRLATLLTWLLWLSLHARFPMALNGGDTLLRLTLFWSLFVPLGARFSVDALHREAPPTRVASLGTAALLGQVVFMYGTNATLKHMGTVWAAGDGLTYTLRLGHFTTVFGEFLGTIPLVTTVLGYTVFVLWTLSPGLLLLTGWKRTLLASLFVSMHVGMALSMHLGLFPAVVVTVLLLFLPTPVWDRLLPPERIERLRRPALEAFLNGLYPTLSTPDRLARLRAQLRVVAVVVILVSLLFVGGFNAQLLTNRADIGPQDTTPEPLETYGETLYLTQYWNMFAPDPLRETGWYRLPGTLANGTTVGVAHGGPVTDDRPAGLDDLAHQYPNQRWRKYLSNLRQPGYAAERDLFLQYHCEQWNREHDADLETIEFEYVTLWVTDDGTVRQGTDSLGRHSCDP